MNKLPPPNTYIETVEFGWVYLEDISDDGIIILRKPIQYSERPNSLGLLVSLPAEHIYVHPGGNADIFVDKDINNIIYNYYQNLSYSRQIANRF